MSENELIKQTEKTFEDIKHIDENGNEYWYARELMVALDYTKWEILKVLLVKLCKPVKIAIYQHLIALPRSGSQ